jgi:hypothetical protein
VSRFDVENLAASGTESLVRPVGFGPVFSDTAILIEINSETGDLSVTVGNGPEHIDLPQVLSDMFHTLSHLSAELANQPDFWIAVGREQVLSEQRKEAEAKQDEEARLLQNTLFPNFGAAEVTFDFELTDVDHDVLKRLFVGDEFGEITALPRVPETPFAGGAIEYFGPGIDPETGYPPYIPSTS